jgi:hypothetical protein
VTSMIEPDMTIPRRIKRALAEKNEELTPIL